MLLSKATGKILTCFLGLVICISLGKLLMCLWNNGPKNNSEVSQKEVNEWLDNLGLGEHKNLFREHGKLINPARQDRTFRVNLNNKSVISLTT